MGNIHFDSTLILKQKEFEKRCLVNHWDDTLSKFPTTCHGHEISPRAASMNINAAFGLAMPELRNCRFLFTISQSSSIHSFFRQHLCVWRQVMYRSDLDEAPKILIFTENVMCTVSGWFNLTWRFMDPVARRNQQWFGADIGPRLKEAWRAHRSDFYQTMNEPGAPLWEFTESGYLTLVNHFCNQRNHKYLFRLALIGFITVAFVRSGIPHGCWWGLNHMRSVLYCRQSEIQRDMRQKLIESAIPPR